MQWSLLLKRLLHGAVMEEVRKWMHVCCIFPCSQSYCLFLPGLIPQHDAISSLPTTEIAIFGCYVRTCIHEYYIFACNITINSYKLAQWCNIRSFHLRRMWIRLVSAFICVEFFNAVIWSILIRFHPIQMMQNLLFLSKIFHHWVVTEKVSKCIHKYYIFAFL
jgi:hypothetical protein